MDFTIKNLPVPVLEDLERAARRHGRSVNDEAIDRLAPATGSIAISAKRRPTAADFRALRAEHPLPYLTPELLDELKREGRL